jgi:hypothetical protein
MITDKDIDDLCDAAAIAGYFVPNRSDLELLVWEKGEGHVPAGLPTGKVAVYIFHDGEKYLKVGKVGEKSSLRYRSHHYKADSCRSNLAKSLIACPEFPAVTDAGMAGAWIRENTTRYNLLIPAEWQAGFLNFAEGFFILRCQPKFEDG